MRALQSFMPCLTTAPNSTDFRTKDRKSSGLVPIIGLAIVVGFSVSAVVPAVRLSPPLPSPLVFVRNCAGSTSPCVDSWLRESRFAGLPGFSMPIAPRWLDVCLSWASTQTVVNSFSWLGFGIFLKSTLMISRPSSTPNANRCP